MKCPKYGRIECKKQESFRNYWYHKKYEFGNTKVLL